MTKQIENQEITFELLEVPSVERSGRTSEGRVLSYVGKNRSGSFAFAANKEFQTAIGNKYKDFFLGKIGSEFYLVSKTISFEKDANKRVSLSPVPEIEGKKLLVVETKTKKPAGFQSIWSVKITEKNSKA
jgi:hypothetical protein